MKIHTPMGRFPSVAEPNSVPTKGKSSMVVSNGVHTSSALQVTRVAPRSFKVVPIVASSRSVLSVRQTRSPPSSCAAPNCGVAVARNATKAIMKNIISCKYQDPALSWGVCSQSSPLLCLAVVSDVKISSVAFVFFKRIIDCICSFRVKLTSTSSSLPGWKWKINECKMSSWEKVSYDVDNGSKAFEINMLMSKQHT